MVYTIPRTFVIALGGNSILRVSERRTFEVQYLNLQETSQQLLEILANGNRIVITHGNGPQVGDMLLASELAKKEVPYMPLDICVAATQGYMGYMIQNTLANTLRENGLRHNITTVISQVVIDSEDPAFKEPTKPVGPFYNSSEAQKLRGERGWTIIKEGARGYRRVVPSPKPLNIQQARIITSMLDAGEIVIAIGGGGIPMKRGDKRRLEGVAAVIDKDYASSRLAVQLEADVFLILTSVEYVFRDFGLPSQQAINHMSLTEAKELLAEGQFGIGSMAPKIGAAIEFLEERDGEVIITLPETANKALQGKTGTRITR